MNEKAKRRIMIATYHTHVLFSTLFKIAVIVFLLWFAFSMFEVCVHNMTMLDENPYQYSNINLFELLMNM
jgi:hypothetical protein